MARAMALQGAADLVPWPASGRAADFLCFKPALNPERASFVPVVARTSVVLAGLGIGLVFFLGHAVADIEGTGPARDEATRSTLPMPMPRIRLLPEPQPSPGEAQAEIAPGDALALSSPIDRVPYEYLLATIDTGSPDDLLQFGPIKIRRHLVQTILKAAQQTEVDPVLLMAIADKESTFSTAARARTSSATGLFQFLDKTWLKVVRDFGAKHGLEKEAKAVEWEDDEPTIRDPAERSRILEMRRDPYIAAVLAAEMLKRDRSKIASKIGRDLSEGETYLAHFLGPADAKRFLAKVVGQPSVAAAKLLPKPAQANRSIFFVRRGRKLKGLSVAEVHRKFETMIGARAERYRNVQAVAGTFGEQDAPTTDPAL